MNNNRHINERALRLPDVIKITGLKRSSIYKYINENAFPKPISLGARCVGWLESEINTWLQTRIAESRS